MRHECVYFEEIAAVCQYLLPQPRKLDRPHPVVTKHIAGDARRQEKIAQYGFYWEELRFGGPIGQRKLRLLNALFLGLSRCGGSASSPRKDDEHHHAWVGDQGLAFTLELPSARKGKKVDSTNNAEEKTLKLAIEWHGEVPECQIAWEDAELRPLEMQMKDIVVGFLVSRSVNIWHMYCMDFRYLSLWRYRLLEV